MGKFILFTGFLIVIAAIRSAMQSGPTNNNTIFLACIAVVVGLYGWFFERFKKMRWLTITIAAMIISVLSFSAFLAAYGRRSTVDYTEDAILILGAGILRGEPRPSLQMRLDQARIYHSRNPSAMIIVTGGLGYGQVISEAESMANYLISHGIPAGQIILEDMAHSTYTNMSFSRDVIDAHFETPPKVAIVTSNFHMFRSVRFARMHGIDAAVYSASTPLVGMPFYYVREVAAVIKMWIIGR